MSELFTQAETYVEALTYFMTVTDAEKAYATTEKNGQNVYLQVKKKAAELFLKDKAKALESAIEEIQEFRTLDEKLRLTAFTDALPVEEDYS